MNQETQNQSELEINENYDNSIVPSFLGSAVVVDRPCDPYQSTTLKTLLETLYFSTNTGQGKHRLLSLENFVSAFTDLIALAIKGNGEINSDYHLLTQEAKIRIPSQMQWVLQRCTTHVNENYRGKFVLTAAAQKSLDTSSTSEVMNKIIKVFETLYLFQKDNRIPYRLAETLPFHKTIIADDSFTLWISTEKGHKAEIKAPYPKVRPSLGTLAAILNAGTVKSLDDTQYAQTVDTVDNLTKALS